jgi:hypothetical protein
MNSLFDESEIPGTYYQSHGRSGRTLELFADRRFSTVERFCLGELDRDQGTWGLEGDTLVLEPERTDERSGRGGVDVRFLPVKWGNRCLLIDEYGMPGFCAEAGGGSPPQWSVGIPNYMKQPALAADPGEGEPLIPDRFREFYEKGPVRATIAAIGDAGMVTLHCGAADRLQPGMRMAFRQLDAIDPAIGFFRTVGGPDRLELMVESVGEHEATARACYFWNSRRLVQVGDEFTTGEKGFSVAGTGVPRLPEPPRSTAAPMLTESGPAPPR